VIDDLGQGVGLARLTLAAISLTVPSRVVADGALANAEGLGNLRIGLPLVFAYVQCHNLLRTELGAIGGALLGQRRRPAKVRRPQPQVYPIRPVGPRNTSCPLSFILTYPLTRVWEPWEVDLLGTLSDEDVAQRTRRTVLAVRCKRMA
jgi:hypothetical protein